MHKLTQSLALFFFSSPSSQWLYAKTKSRPCFLLLLMCIFLWERALVIRNRLLCILRSWYNLNCPHNKCNLGSCLCNAVHCMLLEVVERECDCNVRVCAILWTKCCWCYELPRWGSSSFGLKVLQKWHFCVLKSPASSSPNVKCRMCSDVCRYRVVICCSWMCGVCQT